MKIIIHADPGEAGRAEAERVKRKIESRVAQADGIVDIVHASEPRIVMTDISTGEEREFRGVDRPGEDSKQDYDE